VDIHFQEREATALGWGVLMFHLPFPSCELQQVQLPIITHLQCLMKSKYTSDQLPSTLFCAGLPQGGKDTCQVSSLNS
jgi:trypsin